MDWPPEFRKSVASSAFTIAIPPYCDRGDAVLENGELLPKSSAFQQRAGSSAIPTPADCRSRAHQEKRSLARVHLPPVHRQGGCWPRECPHRHYAAAVPRGQKSLLLRAGAVADVCSAAWPP